MGSHVEGFLTVYAEPSRRFTTADLRRAVKVAEEAGPAWAVDVLPDGTIRLVRTGPETVTAPPPGEAYDHIVL